MNKKEIERQEAIAKLREILKPGDTLFTVMRHVSASGMCRWIDVYHFSGNPDGSVNKSYLSFLVARATGFKLDGQRDCIKIGGCGMDMGFHAVYVLSCVLFPDSFIDKYGHERQGGYALNQEWL